MSDQDRKSFGYTHKIEWQEFHPTFKCFVHHKFYTTADALELHQAQFRYTGITPTITTL